MTDFSKCCCAEISVSWAIDLKPKDGQKSYGIQYSYCTKCNKVQEWIGELETFPEV